MEHLIAVASLMTFIVLLSYGSGASIKSQDPAPCRSEVSRLRKQHLDNNRVLDPMKLPQCDKLGNYKALQRTVKNITCFTPAGSLVDYELGYVAQGPCRRLRKCVKDYQSAGANDHKLVRCDKFGYFKKLQRTETGMICVDSYGNIRKTTNVSRKTDCNDAIFIS